jgi:hypothetical protein
MSRPTETAESYFSLASTRFKNAVDATAKGGNSPEYNLAMGYLDMCKGLSNLNTGVRATYMLLEEIKFMLQHASDLSALHRGMRP